MIPMIQKLIFTETDFTQIAKDIAILIYKDCVNEYIFLKKEIEEQMEQYLQHNVKDVISLFELYIQTKQITNSLILFHNFRNHFLKYERIEEFSWLRMEKHTEKDIELYVQRIKLINSTQFKNTLKVPSQKEMFENLQQKMTQPKQKKVLYYLKRTIMFLKNFLQKLKRRNSNQNKIHIEQFFKTDFLISLFQTNIYTLLLFKFFLF
ncbi:unnamed protein product [Paramecium sonneborni]|uniref:Uncharacterized protein n=1 Tax=Paramecium sonneborni TaxID=65129 RepID=A0A8S1MN30_9CILI|nr:unnamed protein product [Paramecium sonneborni]